MDEFESYLEAVQALAGRALRERVNELGKAYNKEDVSVIVALNVQAERQSARFRAITEILAKYREINS